MDGGTERRIIYVLCLVVLVLGLFSLSRSLDPLDRETVGISLALIAISIVTAIAAGRSGRVSDETADELLSDGEFQ